MKTPPLLPVYFSICAVLAISISGRGADLYIDQNIAQPCTTYKPLSRNCGAGSSTAYARLSAGVDAARAGDTVYIRAGEYREQILPTHAGNLGVPIVFRNYEGESPVITGSNGPAMVVLENVSHISIEGLTVQDCRWVEVLSSNHIILYHFT